MTTMTIDANLVADDAGTVSCRHCETALGTTRGNPLEHARVHERPSTEAGPGVHVDPRTFTERAIVLRQAFCPQCLTLLSTEIVPADEPSFRTWNFS